MNVLDKIGNKLKKALRVKKRGFVYGSYGGLEIGQRVDLGVFYDLYRHNSDVKTVIGVLRKNIANNGFVFENRFDKTKDVSDVDIQKIENIFSSPLSRTKSWRKLRKSSIKDRYISGNFYWHILKNALDEPAGLDRLDPRTVSVVVDAHGNPYRYIQHVVGQDPVVFEPSEILHFVEDEDHDEPAFGMSPLEPIITEAETDKEAAETNLSFFKNDAKPGAVYILDGELSVEEQKSAFEFIKENLSGSSNRNKSTVLSAVKEIKTFGVSQRDMEYLKGRRFNTKKICSALGVNEFIIGWTDAVNNNNGVELRKNLWELTISPEEKDLEEFINEQVLPAFGISDVVVRIKAPNFETMPETENRALRELEAGVITPKEYRIKTGKTTEEFENTPNFKALIVHKGASAVLLEDVGVDPEIVDENEDS